MNARENALPAHKVTQSRQHKKTHPPSLHLSSNSPLSHHPSSRHLPSILFLSHHHSSRRIPSSIFLSHHHSSRRIPSSIFLSHHHSSRHPVQSLTTERHVAERLYGLLTYIRRGEAEPYVRGYNNSPQNSVAERLHHIPYHHYTNQLYAVQNSPPSVGFKAKTLC